MDELCIPEADDENLLALREAERTALDALFDRVRAASAEASSPPKPIGSMRKSCPSTSTPTRSAPS